MTYRIFLFLFISCLAATFTHAQTNTADRLMPRRILTNEDASYNAAVLIPHLHTEGKVDTLKELLDFYIDNFGTGATIAPYIIIDNIRSRKFRETLKPLPASDTARPDLALDSAYYEQYIISYYLTWYIDNFNIIYSPSQPKYYRKTFDAYFKFLRDYAEQTLQQPGLAPVEKFLLKFFSNPKAAAFPQLEGTAYNGTLLQKAWLNIKKDRSVASGANIGLMAGLWSPTGNLSIVGNHPYLGVYVGGKNNRWLFNLSMDARFLRSNQQYYFPVHGIAYSTNYFFGLNIGLDAGYELLRNKRHSFDILTGIALEGFDAFSSNPSPAPAGEYDLSLYTFNYNVGCTYRFYVKHRIGATNEKYSYLALQTRYHFLFYNNEGGSDLKGNAFTIGLLYGAFSRKVDHYYLNAN